MLMMNQVSATLVAAWHQGKAEGLPTDFLNQVISISAVGNYFASLAIIEVMMLLNSRQHFSSYQLPIHGFTYLLKSLSRHLPETTGGLLLCSPAVAPWFGSGQDLLPSLPLVILSSFVLLVLTRTVWFTAKFLEERKKFYASSIQRVLIYMLVGAQCILVLVHYDRGAQLAPSPFLIPCSARPSLIARSAIIPKFSIRALVSNVGTGWGKFALSTNRSSKYSPVETAAFDWLRAIAADVDSSRRRRCRAVSANPTGQQSQRIRAALSAAHLALRLRGYER